jgi:hypothetical protein
MLFDPLARPSSRLRRSARAERLPPAVRAKRALGFADAVFME